MKSAQPKTDIELTKDTPYLGLTGEIWGVCCENFREVWSRDNDITLCVQLRYYHMGIEYIIW